MPDRPALSTTDRVNRYLFTLSDKYRVLLFIILTSLVAHCAGCLASGLAGCLAFAAATLTHAVNICLIAGKCLNTFHNSAS